MPNVSNNAAQEPKPVLNSPASQGPQVPLEEVRQRRSGSNVSILDEWKKASTYTDPYSPGKHPGERTYRLFDNLNTIEDNLGPADAAEHQTSTSK